MKLSVLAVGQMRGAAEAALFDLHAGRIAQSGRALGLDGLAVTEIKDQSGSETRLAAALDKKPNAFIVALDERGTAENSRAFAGRLAGWRDDGVSEIIFLLGAADGLSPDLRARAGFLLSLGPMTWPHLLARALLAEQIYRGISILANHPYHRDR